MHAPVSVIIPCFRNAGTIRRAVDSVAKQTLLPQEVLIIDDASGDDTLDAIQDIQKRFEKNWIKVIALTCNKGPGSARNAGWNAATQPYIAFLDADDSWHPQKVAYQYAFMEANPEVMLTGHTAIVAEEEGTPSNIPPPSTTFISHYRMFCRNPFVTPSIMLRNTSHYRFREQQRHMEDYLLWLQICLDKHPVYMLNATLAYLHKPFSSAGLSAETWNMQKANLGNWWQLRKEKRLSFLLALALSGYSLLKGIRRILLDAYKGLFSRTQAR